MIFPRGGRLYFSCAVCTQLVLFALSWVSEKCYVSRDDFDGASSRQCPRSNLTAICEGVSDVRLDLTGVSPDLEVLCLTLMEGSEVPPDSLARFHKLRSLTITGAKTAILPGAFRNLSGLRTLNVWCSVPDGFSLPSGVFADVRNLTTVFFGECSLSGVSVDVFKDVGRLDKIYINGGFADFSILLCRLAFVSSLEDLDVEASNTTVLKQPDCRFPNGTPFQLKEFSEFKTVSIFFLKLKIFDGTVLRYFKSISYLRVCFENLKYVKSELKSLNYLLVFYYDQEIKNLEFICEMADELSLAVLIVDFIQMTDNFEFNWDKCKRLESLSIIPFDSQTKSVNLTFMDVLRNLTALRLEWPVTPESTEGSGVSGLCETQSYSATQIKMFYLHTNNFQNLTYRHLSCFQDLDEMYVVNSGVKFIEDFTFNNTVLLKYLDLSKNKIAKLTEFSFFGLRNLNTLVLDNNKLITVDPSTFIHLTSLDSLSLGVFQFPTSEPSEIQINLSVPENLTDLYISSGMRPMILHLDNNKKTNTTLKKLHVCGESVTFLDCENSLFESLLQLKAETEQLLCGQFFPARFLKSLTHLEIKPRHNTEQMDLTDLNQLVHLKSLDLYRIDLSSQPDLGVIFHNLSSLEYLKLELCWINSLEKDLSRDLKSLKFLDLSINGVFSMMEDFVEPLNNLKYLIMRHTLLQCSCDNAWFTKWAKYQQNVQVHLWGISLEQIQCKSSEGTKLFYKYAQENCFIDIEFLLFVSTFLGLIFFMLVVLLHQLAGDYLLAFYHIARGWIDKATMASKKGQYSFDVFVSYCGKDEQWVMHELLPNLEKRGPPFLRICLHSRDFQLGKDIVENITDSLYRSRFTLCLVSHNYLRSNWCSLEMRLATYRLLVEHRDVLVLIFLENIPNRMLNAHHRLARLVKTHTYINWPTDPAQHNAFWDRLWAKLAPANAH